MSDLGKIKEWHLDKAIQLKLSGQNVPANFDEIMSDYVKKTDTIPSNKIDRSILDPVYERISNVIDSLNRYRNINTPIGESDLSGELKTRLDNLELNTGRIPDNFEDIVAQAIDDVTSTDEFKETIVNRVSENIAELSDQVSDLQIASTNTTDSISEIENSLASLKTDLVNHILDANNVFRYKDEKILPEDLSDSLIHDLNEYRSNILSLQTAIDSLQRVSISDYSIRIINVAQDNKTLNVLKNNLMSPILYVPTQTMFNINHDPWNKFADSSYNEDYIKLLPDSTTETLEFANNTMTISNIVPQENLITTINNENIVVKNISDSDYNTFAFGFYGGNIKLQISVQIGEEESSEEPDLEAPAVILFNINVDGQAFPFRLEEGINADPMDTFIIAELSSGPHRVEIPVIPNGAFTISTTIGLDNDGHSGLLLKEDIPDASFYDGNIYDDGDYFDIETSAGASVYAFTKTDDHETIDINSYETSQFDILISEGKVIYSPYDQNFYTFKNRKLMCLSYSILDKDDVESIDEDIRNGG